MEIAQGLETGNRCVHAHKQYHTAMSPVFLVLVLFPDSALEDGM